tara:strand:- start:5969 stop:7993 length:2025 start_codon:yes stop_codon:yes gene_type:complete
MLLFSFAMSMGGRQLAQFAKQAAELQAMETAFNNLQGGTENAAVAMDKLRGATDNTMSNFDLFQQANNAMILGITKNSDEMAEMFDMAQRLGRSLGVDTRRSVESLVTGIGRQSRLMLDNIGIVVKSDEAYEAYAEELKKNKDDLTDVEKKQAFLNATLEAAREKVALLGPEVLSPIDSLNKLTAAWDNFSSRLGSVALEVLQPLSEALASILDSLDENRIKSYTIALVGVGGAFGFVKTMSSGATISLKAFKMAAIGTGIGAIVIGLGELITQLGFFKEEQDEATKSTNDFADSLDRIPQTTKFLKERITQIEAENKAREESKKTITDFKKEFEDLAKFEKEYQRIGTDYYAVEKQTEESKRKQAEFLIKNNMSVAEYLGYIAQVAKIEQQVADGKLEMAEAEKRILDLAPLQQQQSILLLEKLKNEIALLELKDLHEDVELEKKEALMEADQKGLDLDFVQQGQLENLIEKKRILLDGIQAEIDLKKEQARIEKGLQNSISQALVSGMNDHDRYRKSFDRMLSDMARSMASKAGTMAIQGFLSLAFPGLGLSNPFAAITGIGDFVGGLFKSIFHQGGQVQGYSTGGMIPGYATGGSIDNVPIMAQEGEYVLRRSAVDSIGLENLNRMNRTGQVSGGANITFTGNIMSDSFIEEEAIPKIKDAIRRGADLGIS